MNAAAHWEAIFRSKAPDAVSWYRPHLETSLDLIRRCAESHTVPIIDVGAGESTLIDDLLARGYTHLAALDISRTAIEVTRKRLGTAGDAVNWIVGDITEITLPRWSFGIWHDRAVFHFLTDPHQRQAYVEAVLRVVRPGGHVIVGAFGPEGPLQCSGLDVVRYDAESIHHEFGGRFRVEESAQELHRTPWGATQQFVYCCCRVE